MAGPRPRVRFRMDGRRLATHALFAAIVGALCTIGTAPFATDPAVAVAFFLCTPLLCALVGVAAAIPETTGRAMGAAAGAAVFAGMGNATAVYVVSQMLSGRAPGVDLGLVVVFSIPYGGAPGLLFAVPMAGAAWAARLACQRDDGGALRPFVCVCGLATPLALGLARTAQADYPLWTLVHGAGTAVAAACFVQAVIDVGLAVHIRRIAAGRDPRRCVVPALPSCPEAGPWMVCRVEAQGDGPYRSADVAHPLRRLDHSPRAFVRARIADAVGLGALALLTAWAAHAA